MNDDDLKRLIMQYERHMAGHHKDFTDEDVIEVLRELLVVKGVISEMKDLMEEIEEQSSTDEMIKLKNAGFTAQEIIEMRKAGL